MLWGDFAFLLVVVPTRGEFYELVPAWVVMLEK
jgi:hypothetical protein